MAACAASIKIKDSLQHYLGLLSNPNKHSYGQQVDVRSVTGGCETGWSGRRQVGDASAIG